MVERDADRGGSVLDPQLGVHSSQMTIHRSGGDEEAFGSLGIGETPCDES